MQRCNRQIAVLFFGAVLAVTTALFSALLLAVRPASAQQDGAAGANFLNPFPENEVWKGIFVGDYLADGLAGGLTDAMAGETRLQLQRRPRTFVSLGRVDIEDDAKQLEELVAKEKIHIAVIMLGMADRGGIRLPNGRRLAVGQGDWRAMYASRVDRIVRSLRRRGVAVYWVGLPIMRRADWNEDVESINEVVRERVLSAGGRYIDAYKESGDENGQFSDRGPDIQGKLVRLRDPEGHDFTPSGYRKLAFFLERQIKRDMNAAREERTIPLAGSEIEQKRINPDSAGLAAGQPESAQAQVGAKGGVTVKDARAAASPVLRALTQGSPGQATASQDSGGDLKADNVRVSFRSPAPGGREEQVTIEIVRPALTQSVIQLMTRRDRGDKPSQVGDTVVDTLSNGLLVMRSVTPTRAGADRGTSRAALTQQPFFIALSKGERLPPKPGRADDFRWPREDDLPPLPVTTAASSVSSPVPLGAQQGGRTQRPQLRVRQPRTEPPRPAQPSSIFQQ